MSHYCYLRCTLAILSLTSPLSLVCNTHLLSLSLFSLSPFPFSSLFSTLLDSSPPLSPSSVFFFFFHLFLLNPSLLSSPLLLPSTLPLLTLLHFHPLPPTSSSTFLPLHLPPTPPLAPTLSSLQLCLCPSVCPLCCR